MNKLFSEENKVPRTLFELERRQGPPHKQSETVWKCCPLRSVCLFRQENKERVYLVCLGIKLKSVNEDFYLLIKISSPKLQSAPSDFLTGGNLSDCIKLFLEPQKALYYFFHICGSSPPDLQTHLNV